MPSVMDILADKGSDVFTISPAATVLEATHSMNDQKIGALVVKDGGGRVMGIFTERDVLRRVIGKQLDPATVRVGEVLTGRVICCTPATSIDEARELMRAQRIRHLPVLDSEGEVVGVISIGDLNAYQTTHQETTIHYLHEYLHGRV